MEAKKAGGCYEDDGLCAVVLEQGVDYLGFQNWRGSGLMTVLMTVETGVMQRTLSSRLHRDQVRCQLMMSARGEKTTDRVIRELEVLERYERLRRPSRH